MDDTIQVLKTAQKLYEAECWEDAYLLVKVLISRKHMENMGDALFLSAKICEAKNEYRLAIEYYSKATKFIHNCSLDDINYRIGCCYIKLKSFKEAGDAVIIIL
jgi:tetratricopeptide (TPR) repeat protein